MRLNPDCFAWWWPGTRSSLTLAGGCRAGAHTCIPTESALSKLNVAGRFHGRFDAPGRSMFASLLTILDTA